MTPCIFSTGVFCKTDPRFAGKLIFGYCRAVDHKSRVVTLLFIRNVTPGMGIKDILGELSNESKGWAGRTLAI